MYRPHNQQKLRRHKPEDGDRLDVRRLREQIEPSHRIQHILIPSLQILTLLDNHPYIPRLRVDIAAHIHDCLAPEQDQLFNEPFVRAFARRVDDNRRLVPREILYGLEDVRRVTGNERDFVFRDLIHLGVPICPLDRAHIEFDTSDSLEGGGQRQREQSISTVGVHQMCHFRLGWRTLGEDHVANIRRERYENRVVVLEEGGSRVLEDCVADTLEHSGSLVCHTDFLFRVGRSLSDL